MPAQARYAVSRVAVARAKARMPDLVPDTVEVVELARGRLYVVIRAAPSGVVVLDERGRLVRGRSLIATIARHLDAVTRVRATLEEARIDQRLLHAEQAIALLERQRRLWGSSAASRRMAATVEALVGLRARLDAVVAEIERGRSHSPTERTLRRTIGFLNQAASADRTVALAVRLLAAELARADARGGAHRTTATALSRWLVARLSGTDLPFFYRELDEALAERFVSGFLASTRV
jgi:hypothetical protein